MDFRKICWYMTEKCHLRCPFCYAFKEDSHPKFEQLRRIGEALVNQHVTTVNLAGGEPLLNTATFQIVDFFHDQMELSLTTSLSLPNISKLLLVAHRLSRICASIDSVDPAEAKILRGTNYDISVVLRNLELVANSSEKLEINTVVTSRNRHSLEGIADHISRLRCDVTWKLFQVTYNQNNPTLESNWAIRNEEFDTMFSRLRAAYRNLEMIPYRSQHLNANYVIIRPTGDICSPSINNYQPIGNVVRDNINDVMAPWLLGRVA